MNVGGWGKGKEHNLVHSSCITAKGLSTKLERKSQLPLVVAASLFLTFVPEGGVRILV